jgi:hypothetical protein
METSEQAPQGDSQQQAESAVEAMFLRGVGSPEPEKTEQPAETETQEAKPDEQEPTQTEPEVAEVEIDGEIYQVPQKIKDRFIHHADYTRKTQEIAEARRVVASQEQSLQLKQAFDQETASERSNLAAIELQLEQYKKLDWGSMDVEQMVRTRHQYDQIKEMKADLEKQLQGKRQSFDEKVGKLKTEAREAGMKYIQQKIKGWSDDKGKELMSYGLNEGYTSDELQNVMDPRIVVTLWKAAQYDRLQSGKTEVMNRARNAPPVVKPGAAQKPTSHKQILQKQIRESKDPKVKTRAAEEYFATIFK